MKERYFFQDKNMTYIECLRKIEEMLLIKNAVYIGDEACMTKGANSIPHIISEEKRKKFIETAYETDHNFNYASSPDRNVGVKLPIILTSAVLIDKYYDKIVNLTTKELCLSSFYLSINNYFNNEEIMNMATDKELLSAVQEKKQGYAKQIELLRIVPDYFMGDDVNMEKIKFSEEKDKWIYVIRNSSDEEIAAMNNYLLENLRSKLKEFGL